MATAALHQEMSEDEKNAMSHRGRAAARTRAALADHGLF